MFCPACGAPMTLFRERSYFFCEYCGTFHFPTVSSDGVRLLGEAPDKRTCPVCQKQLLIASIDESYPGYQCGKCRGLLLDRFTFREILQRRRAAATTPPDPPQPRNLAELERHLRCPECGRRMDTHPYYGPGNIIIDTCHTCNAIWLDPMEMARAVNAAGSDRGPASQRHLPKGRHTRPRAKPQPEPVGALMGFLDKLFD